MTSKHTITLLSVFLLLGGPYSSFAQEDEQYRIGIFPAGGCFGNMGQCPVLSEQTVRLLQEYIERDSALVLAYSYYHGLLNKPRIRNVDKLWVGGAAQKKPNLPLVYQIGRERDLDSVVMLWGVGVISPGGVPSARETPIEFYVIDIKHRQVYHRKGTAEESSIVNITNRVVAEFVKGRSKVAQATAAETIQPEFLAAGSQQAERSTPYRIGIFPGGGDFGQGYSGPVEERVARTLQTSIQRDRALTLVYSHYDDVLNEPRIKNRDRLWVGGQVKKKPNVEVVYRLAQERGIDGVVMYWGVRSGDIYAAMTNPMWLYLIDVERRQVYREKGKTKGKSDVDKLTRKLVAQFLTDRPQVMQAKVAEPTQPVTAERSPARGVTPATDSAAHSVDFGTYHALVIGNNDYAYLPKLKTAVNDAQAVARLLDREYGFRINLLRNATESEIISALTRFRENLQISDNLLIYYAGHGTIDDVTRRGYWLPTDAERRNPANWIANDDITTQLKAMRARHVLVVADSCYSGTLTRSTRTGIRTGGQEEWIKRAAEKRSRTVMTSGELEPVLDSDGGNHSVFAKAFLQALRENKGVIDTDSLFDLVKERVVWDAHQTPVYSVIRFTGHDNGDFIFTPR